MSGDGDGGELFTQVYNFRGREESVVFPRTAEQLQQCIRLGVRTMMMTREQIREWNAPIDIREVPEGHAIEMIFADDDDYYDALVFDDLDSLGMEEPLEPLSVVGP